VPRETSAGLNARPLTARAANALAGADALASQKPVASMLPLKFQRSTPRLRGTRRALPGCDWNRVRDAIEKGRQAPQHLARRAAAIRGLIHRRVSRGATQEMNQMKTAFRKRIDSQIDIDRIEAQGCAGGHGKDMS